MLLLLVIQEFQMSRKTNTYVTSWTTLFRVTTIDSATFYSKKLITNTEAMKNAFIELSKRILFVSVLFLLLSILQNYIVKIVDDTIHQNNIFIILIINKYESSKKV